MDGQVEQQVVRDQDQVAVRPELGRDGAQQVLGELAADVAERRDLLAVEPRAVVRPRQPLVHGGILRFDGRVTTIIPRKSACYRCVFKAPPPPGLVASCQEAGVIGVLAGIIGTIQATEAIKLIVGVGEPLAGRLLLIDTLGMLFRTVHIRKDPLCPACGTREIQALIDYEQFCGVRAAEAEPRAAWASTTRVISRAAAALVRAGFARRGKDAADERSAIFTLTRQGQKKYETVIRMSRERQRRLIAQLEPEERRVMFEAVGRLIEYVRKNL